MGNELGNDFYSKTLKYKRYGITSHPKQNL